MPATSLAELLQRLRQQLAPRWVLVALEQKRLRIQEWRPGRPVEKPAWILPLPDGLCVEGRPTNIEALGAFLGDFLIDQGVVAAHALAVLPPECVQWRVLEGLQPGPLEGHPQLCLQEKQLRLPKLLDHWQLALRALPSTSERSLLVAGDRVAVEGWIEVFAQAGLTLDRLAPAQICWMEGLWRPLASLRPPQSLVLLHEASDGGVWLVIWQGFEPYYQRRLRGTTDQWMDELLRILNGLHLMGATLIWDGTADALLGLRAQGLSTIDPAECDGFDGLALAGLVRAEMSDGTIHR